MGTARANGKKSICIKNEISICVRLYLTTNRGTNKIQQVMYVLAPYVHGPVCFMCPDSMRVCKCACVRVLLHN